MCGQKSGISQEKSGLLQAVLGPRNPYYRGPDTGDIRMSRLAALLLCPLLGHPAAAVAGEPVVDHSSIAFTLKEKDLLPENLAYDPESGNFFVGSTRKGKILRVAPNCREWDFVTARAD